jgi:hypothetical protein
MKLLVPKIGKAKAHKLRNTYASSYSSLAHFLATATSVLPQITHLAAQHYFRGYLIMCTVFPPVNNWLNKSVYGMEQCSVGLKFQEFH